MELLFPLLGRSRGEKEMRKFLIFLIHFVCPLALLFLIYEHVFHNCLKWLSPFDVIVGVDLYIFGLIFLAAIEYWKPLPEKWMALFAIPALFLILVVSFGELYAKNGNIKRARPEGGIETINEHDQWNAAYFSLVTITTLGYGDFAPQDWASRKIVMGELLSGVLLVLLVLPVLASRLSMFDEPATAKMIVNIEKLDGDQWRVTRKGSATTYRGKTLDIEVAAEIEPDIKGKG
jgi:Ion channel